MKSVILPSSMSRLFLQKRPLRSPESCGHPSSLLRVELREMEQPLYRSISVYGMEKGAPHFLQALPVPASRNAGIWFARGHALSWKNSRYPSLSLFPSSPSNRAAGILLKKTLSFSILLCGLGSPLSGEGGPHLDAEPKINQCRTKDQPKISRF